MRTLCAHVVAFAGQPRAAFLTACWWLSGVEGHLSGEPAGSGRCCMPNLFQAGAVVSCAGQAR